MKVYKRLILLSFICIVAGLYFLIQVLNTKPICRMEYSIGTTLEGTRRVEVNGAVVSNNKYQIESSKVKIRIFDYYGVEIDSQIAEYRKNVEFMFQIDYLYKKPYRIKFETFDTKIDYKTDLIISLILICSGLAMGVTSLAKLSKVEEKTEL